MKQVKIAVDDAENMELMQTLKEDYKKFDHKSSTEIKI